MSITSASHNRYDNEGQDCWCELPTPLVSGNNQSQCGESYENPMLRETGERVNKSEGQRSQGNGFDSRHFPIFPNLRRKIR